MQRIEKKIMNQGLNMRTTPLMITLRVLHMTLTNSIVCLPHPLEFFIGFHMWFLINSIFFFVFLSNLAYNMARASPASSCMVFIYVESMARVYVALHHQCKNHIVKGSMWKLSDSWILRQW
jgi:hypothetical protein